MVGDKRKRLGSFPVYVPAAIVFTRISRCAHGWIRSPIIPVPPLVLDGWATTASSASSSFPRTRDIFGGGFYGRAQRAVVVLAVHLSTGRIEK